MLSKKAVLSNFSRSIHSESRCLRPDSEKELADYMACHPRQSILVRGSGLSYNDSCFNTHGYIVESSHFNHLIDFDAKTGIVICQGGVPLKDLFLVHPEFIPAVIPGTVHATVAGSIAHDVHGKNNPQEGSFGHHILWFDLLLGKQKFHCSPKQHSDLFYATIAGLGLTGVITQVALRLKKTSRFVLVKHKQFTSFGALTDAMLDYSLHHDYQVAWLDLLHKKPQSILSIADHCDALPNPEPPIHAVPKLPFCILRAWNVKLFNQLFFNTRKAQEKVSLMQFNNPLDKIMHWNRLYGPKGLIQFQAVFPQANATELLTQFQLLINTHDATPTLSVLKLFLKAGKGLLSFCQPGFTLAIDFINNCQAQKTIAAMNELLIEYGGSIYLAKDLLLNADQYKKIYGNHQKFSQLLKQYDSSMHSDLAKRLGIIS
ncbi:MAG: FAD-binding oxidoreductase [Legionella sp.]|uniref:FAD-binding oxidoreductase n=1 Tax=Legionella sp. TaxID=459 RepID=UPI0039E57D03